MTNKSDKYPLPDQHLYEEVSVPAGTKLHVAVTLLQDQHKQGKKVFCEFNGHYLYSDTVTQDSAHQEVLNMSYKEFTDKYPNR